MDTRISLAQPRQRVVPWVLILTRGESLSSWMSIFHPLSFLQNSRCLSSIFKQRLLNSPVISMNGSSAHVSNAFIVVNSFKFYCEDFECSFNLLLSLQVQQTPMQVQTLCHLPLWLHFMFLPNQHYREVVIVKSSQKC